jgi:EAL domain-containing protein (putative c-di-GMP-specific phosphodiesterase class I)
MAQLIPASIRVDHAQKLDKLIVTNLLQRLHFCTTKVGVNISRLSIFDPEFMEWFIVELQGLGEQCNNLVVEISERALVNNIDELLVQTNRLKALGVQIAVERFGGQLVSILHLNKLAPDYLKIDGRFTKNIHTEMDNQLFIGSLINIAQGLNIKVIAEMVETKAEQDWLMAAQIDYFQGYFIAAPKLVDDAH